MSHRIGIIGAGPRAVLLLERILASADSILGGEKLEVYLVDPYPVAGGRIWRKEQSPLLWMNSRAEDVTFFPDDSVQIEGPLFKGPTLWEWIRDEVPNLDVPEAIKFEASQAQSGTFPSRILQHEYLSWFFQKLLNNYSQTADLNFHQSRAVDLQTIDGTERIFLEDGTHFDVDVVLLAQGHLDTEPSLKEKEFLSLAAEHGLTYIPTAHTADLNFDEVLPGEDVLVQGFGLAFIDLLVLLTQGRGGRYEDVDGELKYISSGQEPHIIVGSSRGVPYRSKIGYSVGTPAPKIPRYLTVDAIKSKINTEVVTDFRTQVWPLIAKDLAYAHYSELFRANPERTNISWEEFESVYDQYDWYAPELRTLEAKALKNPLDVLDFEKLDRPLKGLKVDSLEELQATIRNHIAADYTRRHDSSFSSDAAVFSGLLQIFGGLGAIIQSGLLTPRTIIEDIEGTFFGFFSYVASGPPGPRLRQIQALSHAGVLTFLGSESEFNFSPEIKKFVAKSVNVDTQVVARALIEARIPDSKVEETIDSLIQNLLQRGEVSEDWAEDEEGLFSSGKLLVHPRSGRLAQADGTFAENRFAAGPWVKGGLASSGFARPRTNAFGFKYNDNLGREILRQLASKESSHTSIPNIVTT